MNYCTDLDAECEPCGHRACRWRCCPTRQQDLGSSAAEQQRFPPAVLLTNSIQQKKDEILSSLAAVPRVVIMEAADLADSVSQ